MAILEADGLEGSTLLGFLAGMGSLRLLAEKHASARLWFDRGADRARFDVPELSNREEVLSAIVERYRCADRKHELAQLRNAEKPGDVSSDHVLSLAKDAWSNACHGAFVAGLVCDGVTRAKDPDKAAETTLCAANGAGHQAMFRTMRDLLNARTADGGKLVQATPALVTEAQIRGSLLKRWDYQDEVPEEAKGWMGNRKPTLRWDEGAERLYALRLYQPNDDPEPFRTQLGAYALAAAALPCLAVVPTRRGGQTVFTRRPRDRAGRQSSTEIDFYWCLWGVPASLATVAALEASGEPLTDPPSARRRGVYRLMRARRTSMEKGKLVFGPAEAVW